MNPGLVRRHAAGLTTLLLCGACAQLNGPAPVPADQPGSLGVLDSTYDRTKWRWVRNPDGRSLLSHATIQKCFIDPKPGDDFNEPGFAVKRERKTIGKTSYEVLNVHQGRDFWEAVYQREGSREPLLGVLPQPLGILVAHRFPPGIRDQMSAIESKNSLSSAYPPRPLYTRLTSSANSIASIHFTILNPSWFSTRNRSGAP